MITIAHRIDTIIDNDWVIVMHEGKAIEQGRPRDLLVIDERDTKVTNLDGAFAKLVLANGEEKAQYIFEKTKV